MKEVKAYQVVKADTGEGLTYRVTTLLGEGWQPVEGMRVTTEVDEHDITTFYFYQTMVQYED